MLSTKGERSGAEGGLFGRIAIEKGFLDEAQLARAVRTQEEIRALGLGKPLGEILVAEGALTAEQVDLVLRLQKKNTVVWSARRFARIAAKNGFVEEKDAEAAVETAARENYKRTVGEILVAQEKLSGQAERAIRQAIARMDKKLPALDATERDRSTTSRLESELLVDAEPIPETLEDRRRRDVLFAAVAFRDGVVLLSELEKALEAQAEAKGAPPLEFVLVARGVLSEKERGQVDRSLETAREEKVSLPGYKLTGVLGHGATSIVVRARHELIDREVAIKLFRPEYAAGEDADALLAEAKTIAKIRHPNVVGLYDAGRVHRRFFYVMELVDGPTLLDEIQKKGPLPEREALERAREVALALDAIHQAGLVHRDVKPLNILIAKDGTAKLTDLGLAHEADAEQDEPYALRGTPHTISPEQAQGQKIDIRSDLYSLGATLYHALTGRPPYEGKEAVGLVVQHVTGAVPDPRQQIPFIRSETAELVMALLQKDPKDRPDSPRTVVEAIEAILTRLGKH